MIQKDRINEAIEKTNDPAMRAVYLILASHDEAMVAHGASMSANTAALERVAKSVGEVHGDLVTHIHDEEKMLAQIKGGQYVGGVLLVAVIALAGYVVQNHFARNERQDTDIAELSVKWSQVRTVQIEVMRRLDALEKDRR